MKFQHYFDRGAQGISKENTIELDENKSSKKY
jgi:hypothetical protein